MLLFFETRCILYDVHVNNQPTSVCVTDGRTDIRTDRSAITVGSHRALNSCTESDAQSKVIMMAISCLICYFAPGRVAKFCDEYV